VNDQSVRATCEVLRVGPPFKLKLLRLIRLFAVCARRVRIPTVSTDKPVHEEFERAAHLIPIHGCDEDDGVRRHKALVYFVHPVVHHPERVIEASLIHCPLNAVLDWPMCMPSGYAVFRDPVVNAKLKQVLNVRSGFLDGPHSRKYLNSSAPEGWLSAEAQEQLGLSQFVCDPDKPYWGFESWNSFFTRRFLPDARPVAEPANSKIIVSACEASPYNIQHDVKLRDRFWIKSQPYSLDDMFTTREREIAQRFVGGSVYQAFLSAFNYHRWHAPVSGRIVKAYHVDGSYYSEAESEGIDPGGLNDSQGYTTAVAARAVIVIDCDDPAIGLVGCVFVGMADVSSCVV
jgi:phosphatidylserine decarboxylase